MNKSYPSQGVAQAPQDHTMDAAKYMLHRSELEKLKQEFIAQKEMYETKTSGKFPRHAVVLHDFDELVQAAKNAQQKIESLQKELTQYENLAEQIKEMKFKIGDVAYHKDYGNVVVKGVSIGNDKDAIVCGYAIVCRKGEYTVEQNELLPINETTKVLYGK
jgi:fructose-specific phosphotransferase system component IIB